MSGEAAEALRRCREHLDDARDSHAEELMRLGALERAAYDLVHARRKMADPGELRSHVLSVLDVAIAQGHHNARALVPQVAEDSCLREPTAYAAICSRYLERALGDEHVVVVKRAIRALTILFRRVMGAAIHLGVGDGFPDDAFARWCDMQRRAVALMGSEDAGVQKAATKFAETAALALSYSGGPASASHFTLDFAARAPPHPLLKLDVLEAEGRRVVSCVAAFIYQELRISPPTRAKVVPQSAVSSASLLTAFSVIGNLVKRRPKVANLTLPPLLLSVRAVTGEQASRISPAKRWTLIKVIKHILKSCVSYPHIAANAEALEAFNQVRKVDEQMKHENQMRNHQPAVKREATNAVNAAPMHSGGTVKRPRAQYVPPRQAWDTAQLIINSMSRNEVAHFVMTRLILDTPPALPVMPAYAEQVDGAERMASVRKRPRPEDAATTERDAVRQVARRVAKPVRALQLDEQGTQRLVYRCCRSILARETLAMASGAGELRVQVLSRLLAWIAQSDSKQAWALCRDVCKFVADDVHNRCELALAWLHATLVTYAAQKAKGTKVDDPKMVVKAELHESAPSPSQSNVKPSDTPSETAPSSSNPQDAAADSAPNATEQANGGPHAEEKMDQSAADAAPPETTTDMEVVADGDQPPDAGKTDAVPNGKSEDHAADAQAIPKSESAATAPLSSSTTTPASAPMPSPTVGTESGPASTSTTTPGPVATSTSTSAPVSQSEPETQPKPQTDDKQTEVQSTAALAVQAKMEVDDDDEEQVMEDVEEMYDLNSPAYERVLTMLIDELQAKGVEHDKVRRLIVEAPILPECIVKRLHEECRDVEKNELALHALRDVVCERYGADRNAALQILLDLAVDGDAVVRGPVIRLVAERLHAEVHGDVPARIEAFAFDGLKKSLDDPKALEQTSWLPCALCAQRHELLPRMVDAYRAAASDETRSILLNRADTLASQLDPESPHVSAIVAQHNAGAEDLALTLLSGVVKKAGLPSPALVAAGCARHAACGDARFLEAVLSGMGREALEANLGALVAHAAAASGAALEAKDALSVSPACAEATAAAKPFARLIRTAMEARPPALAPAELLVALHALPDGAAAQAAVRACFELRAIFKQPVVSQALLQLVSKPQLPQALMRTVLLAQAFHDDAEPYLAESIVVPLIKRSVWKVPALWRGFLGFCGAAREWAAKIVLRLPQKQLEEALADRAILAVFAQIAANPRSLKKINPVKRRVIVAAVKKGAAGE